jgi:CBS domain-containing protein
MNRDRPVSSIMTTDVLTFTSEQPIKDAMEQLVAREVDGAPVVDDVGTVVGMLSTGDLIVQDARLHGPTVISLLGAYIELPSWRKEADDDFEKATSLTVGHSMDDEPVVVKAEDTVETAATAMHDHDVSRLPVVDGDGKLVGLVARGDILRCLVEDFSSTGDDA